MSTPPKPHLKLVSSKTIPPKRPKRDLGAYRQASIVFVVLLAAPIAFAALTDSLTLQAAIVGFVFAAVVGGSVLAGGRKATR